MHGKSKATFSIIFDVNFDFLSFRIGILFYISISFAVFGKEWKIKLIRRIHFDGFQDKWKHR